MQSIPLSSICIGGSDGRPEKSVLLEEVRKRFIHSMTHQIFACAVFHIFAHGTNDTSNLKVRYICPSVIGYAAPQKISTVRNRKQEAA